jgi:hypothetical protein
MNLKVMKPLAIALIVVAFLAGAFISVLHPTHVQWPWMIAVLIIGSVGLFLYRRVMHGETRSSQLLAGNIELLATCLRRISKNLNELHLSAESLPTYEARFEIDRLFREDLDTFAEARESMVHVFGIQNYADVMSNFAAGERYINRVWSASTDGYVDEVILYLGRAREQFEEAERHFREVREGLASQQGQAQGAT